MVPQSKSLRGKLQLTVDPALLAASLSYVVDAGGEAWDLARVRGLLKSQGLRWGPEGEGQIEGAFCSLANIDSGLQTIVALSGEAAGDPVHDALEWKSQPTPQELAAQGELALAAALPPRVFDIQVTKEKVEEIQKKKAALPFLKPKEEKVVKVVRRENRVEVGVDPKPEETGFARRNDVLAIVLPGKAGKEGRNVRGERIAARKPDRVKVLVGGGVALRGNEVRAMVDGFYRRGRNWIDLVPYREGELRVYASADRGTCLLDFAPGTAGPPKPDQVLAKAKEAGFAAADLIRTESIEALLARSVEDSKALAGAVLSRMRDGGFEIKVAPDRMRATLALRKGSGQGKPLSLTEVGKAISARGFKSLDCARVRQDILGFQRGPDRELCDYVLAEGTPAVPATDGAVQWLAEFLTPARSREIEARLGADTSNGFPPAAVKQTAFVKAGQLVGRVLPAAAGSSGRDVCGVEVTVPPGKAPDLRLVAGLELKDNAIAARTEGVLEIAGSDCALFARVREFHESEVSVRIGDSRMEAYLSLYPAAKPLNPQTVRAAIAARGVVKGVDSRLVEDLVARASRGETVRDALVAKGSPPTDQKGRRLSFHGNVVMGRSFLLASGSRAQNLTVKEGEEIAEILPPPAEAQDGCDVLGTAIPGRRAPALEIKVGPNVERRAESDGRVRFVTRKAGEVFYDGTLLDVKDTLVIQDAGGSGPPVRFLGSVQVKGSVMSGARIFSGGDVQVAQMIERAVVSSEGSILVAGGIKGGAMLRAKNNITATYAEQSTLLGVGEIRIKNSCLQCQIRCNSRVVLDGEKASLIGGRLKARSGMQARHVGNEKHTPTEISFGQDYLVEDQIGVGAREVEKVEAELARVDAQLAERGRGGVEDLSREKVRCLKALERHTMRLFSLREKFETHFPSEIVVEGTLYPGVVFESHGRTLEVDATRARVVVSFDQATGRITIGPLNGRG